MTPLTRPPTALNRSAEEDELPDEEFVAAQPFDLLDVPVLGRLLKWRHSRTLLQIPVFAISIVMIFEGLLGPSLSPKNMATVLTWVHFRGALVLVILLAGNLFCLACPFMLARNFMRRFVRPRFTWPRRLRNKWIPIALFVLVLFAYELFGLWSSPWLTAWMIVGYFAAVLVVDGLFTHATFCKYVCPIGQFNFVGSLISPTTVKIHSESTCNACETRDCIRGNTRQRGCELELYLPEKRSNADCTLCMDCVKACPHDNIGIVARSLTQDVLVREPTSSLGRLSRRTDVAAVALVLVFAGFANAAAMVAPGADFLSAAGRRMPWLGTTAGSFAGVVAGMLLGAGAVWVASQADRSDGLRREAFCRGALTLVPLGMGMWAAHLLFHLLMGLPGLLPLFQQSGQDFGLHWLGVPHWSAGGYLLQGNGLLQLQLLFLDGGLLLSLYLVWRTVAVTGVARRLLSAAPLALLTVALYGFGFWLLLEPMQMRGMMMGGM